MSWLIGKRDREDVGVWRRGNVAGERWDDPVVLGKQVEVVVPATVETKGLLIEVMAFFDLETPFVPKLAERPVKTRVGYLDLEKSVWEDGNGGKGSLERLPIERSTPLDEGRVGDEDCKDGVGW